MDIEKMKSDLIMRNLYFSQCSFSRALIIKDAKLKMSLSSEITKVSEHIYLVEVNFIAKDGTQFDLSITANAEFEYESDRKDANLEEKIISQNTIAIMFPFIRSQVSLITTQPHLQPLIIPPINVSKFK